MKIIRKRFIRGFIFYHLKTSGLEEVELSRPGEGLNAVIDA